ncbi:MAG: hypothetical protein PVS3B3_34490 [Ktedonobacteraceae bacterium]
MAVIEAQILETSEKITPKSVLRHRPIGNGNSKLPTGRHSVVTNATTPIVQRASRPRTAEHQDDISEWKRADASDKQKGAKSDTPKDSPGVKPSLLATRHVQTVVRPLSTTPRPKLVFRKSKAARQAHPLLYLGIGMIAMLLLWTVLSSIFGWFATTVDDIRYGRPRTYQTDQFVGHGEQNGVPSHFIAVNLNRRIEIIELPGGDATHAKIYLGPQLYATNDELTPVTLIFADVNGDHKPDMIVNFQASRIVFINDQGGFRPPLPAERHQVEQFLKHANLSS